ncbi:MAG: hypothetical protein ABI353_20745, partial [Isosphaeraceae bacterium]
DPEPLRPGHPACELIGMVGETNGVAIEGTEAAREVIRRVRPILDQERQMLTSRDHQDATAVGKQTRKVYHEYQVRAFLQSLGSTLPPEMADEAAEGVDLGEPPRPFYAEAYAEMLDHLRFRRDMHREFAS